MLNEQILRDCEEFFELIVNESGDLKLDQAIDKLRTFLERDVDGWTQHSEEVLARAVQCRIMEIWGLIPRAEKQADPDLKEYYDTIVGQLEDVSGYETDEADDCEEDS
jgi:hypothetical protein